MTNGAPRCEACGREYGNLPGGVEEPSLQLQPSAGEPTTDAQRHLSRQIELFEQLTGQMDQLLELVQQGDAGSQQVLDELEALRQRLRPRHGLCIDRSCAMCRVHEEAIKEHVLLYVDWKIPGTITKLQQARQQN